MKNYPCSFKNYCQHPGEGCDSKSSAWCPEALRIKEILKTPCLVMIAAGYDPKKDKNGVCRCNIPQIRLSLPAGAICNPNGKCISENFDNKTRASVFTRSEGNVINVKKPLARQIAKQFG